MRTSIMVRVTLIVLAVMGAGCASESSVNAPDPVVPLRVAAPGNASTDAEFLERLATMKVNICRGNDRVLVVVPPVDDPRVAVRPTLGDMAC